MTPAPKAANATEHDSRRALREKLIVARQAAAAPLRAQWEAAIREHLANLLAALAPQVVGWCWPFRGEPDLRPLLANWLAGSPRHRAVLPVVAGAGQALQFRQWTATTPMREDRYGIPTPTEGALLQPEVLLIPVNAFDAAGHRLGYGAGYFDRTLAALAPRPLAVGVGFELARVADLRPQAHDQPLDYVATEAGLFRRRQGWLAPLPEGDRFHG